MLNLGRGFLLRVIQASREHTHILLVLMSDANADDIQTHLSELSDH